jgi:hypothetical protein
MFGIQIQYPTKYEPLAVFGLNLMPVSIIQISNRPFWHEKNIFMTFSYKTV